MVQIKKKPSGVALGTELYCEIYWFKDVLSTMCRNEPWAQRVYPGVACRIKKRYQPLLSQQTASRDLSSQNDDQNQAEGGGQGDEDGHLMRTIEAAFQVLEEDFEIDFAAFEDTERERDEDSNR